ncbi:MAG: hypothetical protein AB7O98_16845 [Hyphomonadaceae bacterium]
MRTLLCIAALLASAPLASAQTVIAPPATPPPPAVASVETRDSWCQAYAAWLVALTPSADERANDVSETHRLQVELASCRLDPQRYELETRAEVNQAIEVASG